MSTHTGTRSPGSTRPARRLVQLGCTALVLAGAGVAFSGGAATAAPDTGTTTANAVVESGITLTGLTSAFTLTGTPGATVTGDHPVTYNVETNNAGYSVSVTSVSATMAPVGPSTDTIPVGDLTVREGTGAYSPVGLSAVTVHSQDTRSANTGDNLSSNFQMRIPTVAADTYQATLNYVAFAN